MQDEKYTFPYFRDAFCNRCHLLKYDALPKQNKKERWAPLSQK
jgi:cytochrome c5